ncbi:DUF5064 family protein [Pseudomonas sp. Q1-7]|uniref:DUF5064 family protein n=1 Tax=Pseudomonas sp. Q1-7 TaxID=3020843 RepID=UPI002301B98B|nr:DUF5064 family protein [Pseudomonas sp. Q1-7]
MFEPGHIHRANLPGFPGQQFSVDIYYEARPNAQEGTMLHFRMVGEIDGKPFEEEFELHRDTAFNFASVLSKAAVKHGLHPNSTLIMRNHKEYDQVFEDIRRILGAAPGEAVNFDHLEKDRF